VLHAKEEKELKWKIKQEKMQSEQKIQAEDLERRQLKKRKQIEDHLERLSIERQEALRQSQADRVAKLRHKQEVLLL
jgi:uncharacterized glyoxalase superfamily metalloenzyme YdcJ